MTPEYFAALARRSSLYTSSHIAEIVRGSIQAVPRGQGEAADALALSGFQRVWYVVLPQAMRIAVPPIGNQYLNLAKNSSLAAVISFPELTKVTQLSVANRSPAVPSYALLLLIYLVLSPGASRRRQPRQPPPGDRGALSDDATSIATDRRLLAMPEPAPPPSRDARDWLRQNLFRSCGDAILTVVAVRGGRDTCSTAPPASCS